MDITAVIKNYVVAEFLPGVQMPELDDEYHLARVERVSTSASQVTG